MPLGRPVGDDMATVSGESNHPRHIAGHQALPDGKPTYMIPFEVAPSINTIEGECSLLAYQTVRVG